MRGTWWLEQTRVSWTFHRPHNIWQQWHRSTGYHIGSRKWLPHQAWCHRHPKFCHWKAEPHPYTCSRHSLKRPPVACLVMPLHFLWIHCMHCEHWIELLPTTLEQAAPEYMPDFLTTAWPTPETKNLVYLVFFRLTRSSLLSILAFHALSLEIHSSWVFVMNNGEEKLPRHTNAELMWKRLHHRDEEQWAKGRVLMHINSHAKLIIVLTIDLLTTLGIGVHDLNDMHSPFCNPVSPLRPAIGPSLKHDRRLSEGRQRQSNVVC